MLLSVKQFNYISSFVYCRVSALLILDLTLKKVKQFLTEKVGSFRLVHHTIINHHLQPLQYVTVVQWFSLL